jgi:hypothetical protein
MKIQLKKYEWVLLAIAFGLVLWAFKNGRWLSWKKQIDTEGIPILDKSKEAVNRVWKPGKSKSGISLNDDTRAALERRRVFLSDLSNRFANGNQDNVPYNWTRYGISDDEADFYLRLRWSISQGKSNLTREKWLERLLDGAEIYLGVKYILNHHMKRNLNEILASKKLTAEYFNKISEVFSIPTKSSSHYAQSKKDNISDWALFVYAH